MAVETGLAVLAIGVTRPQMNGVVAGKAQDLNSLGGVVVPPQGAHVLGGANRLRPDRAQGLGLSLRQRLGQ